MISLGTHQSALWGYSILTYPSDNRLPASNTPASTASISYNGIFTKLTLAPNGNMYAIMLCTDLTINGVSQTSVFLKITPGTSNTGTTNWQAATRTYLVPDTSFTTDPTTGFGRANWTPDTGSGTIRYHTGILAPNGLIYFAPYVTAGGWVIFNPATETWKTTTALKANSFTAALPVSYAFSGIALGTDNKIYAIGGFNTGTKMRSFRFTPTTNALNDVSTIEDSYHSNYIAGGSPLTYADRSWFLPDGSVSYDSPSLDGLNEAHKTVGGVTAIRYLGLIRDMITHPSGKIFLIPGAGRGRIFYINQSGWGTTTELVSEPGYSTASIPSYGAKSIFNYYASLEKPRDASHDPATLKIYIYPVLGTLENTTSYPNMVISDILVINPVTKTMSAMDMGFYNAAPNGNTRMSLSKLANLPNGMSLVFNGVTYSRQGGVVHTGWDVPDTETDGARQITMTGKGILYQPNYYYQNGSSGSIESSQITSGYPQNLSRYIDLNPGFTGFGGGVNALWPHTGKFISNASVSSDINPFAMIVEINSIKGYGPGITNFNFTSRDQTGYQIPPTLTNLGASLFNCQFNKMK